MQYTICLFHSAHPESKEPRLSSGPRLPNGVRWSERKQNPGNQERGNGVLALLDCASENFHRASRSASQPGTSHLQPSRVRGPTPMSTHSLNPGCSQIFIPKVQLFPASHPQAEALLPDAPPPGLLLPLSSLGSPSPDAHTLHPQPPSSGLLLHGRLLSSNLLASPSRGAVGLHHPEAARMDSPRGAGGRGPGRGAREPGPRPLQQL